MEGVHHVYLRQKKASTGPVPQPVRQKGCGKEDSSLRLRTKQSEASGIFAPDESAKRTEKGSSGLPLINQ